MALLCDMANFNHSGLLPAKIPENSTLTNENYVIGYRDKEPRLQTDDGFSFTLQTLSKRLQR